MRPGPDLQALQRLSDEIYASDGFTHPRCGLVGIPAETGKALVKHWPACVAQCAYADDGKPVALTSGESRHYAPVKGAMSVDRDS